ncbi:MAG: tRNA uridine-5-carboxymethylaminomethyl(34) synthesis GTPase MnmE [Omnitrophica bacterium]|nr:tRNA uridine-5-carboxymethylaminomethyl(34) synthesis GTPase MnmE [Candidatus Omnitrophota bacterium]
MRKKALLVNVDDTIAAVSTPVGEGGIGIVRLSGRKALSIADRIFVSKNGTKPSECMTYTVHYGHIMDSRLPAGQAGFRGNDSIVDEVILTVMRAPKSYTKEDVVEINCHGGVVSLRRVLDLLLSAGARLAGPGEFTKRAFINGRIDLAQAEAVLDIIKSRTEGSLKVALGHLEGELSRKITALRDELLDVLSEIEAGIDFSDEDIEPASGKELYRRLGSALKEIKDLIDNSWQGMVLKEGILSVICGKPNVGKSSLMNALLRRNRVIVTPSPGTTRDAIEEEINLKGIPVRVVDTAGISRPKGIAEKHGIKKSKSYINKADLILFMLDLSRPWTKADSDILSAIKRKNFITIANKSDLKRKLNIHKIRGFPPDGEIIEASLLRNKNVGHIEEKILRKVWRGEIMHPEATFISNLRHKKDLEMAAKSLGRARGAFKKRQGFTPEIAASNLREAVFFLGSILGDAIEPDILERVFSKFCVGK